LSHTSGPPLPDALPISGHRCKAAAMMAGWTELRERLEMLGHAVAHVALEAVTGMGKAEPRHQPVARHLGDDRGRRDRGDEPVAADHRFAFAGNRDAVAAVDEDQPWPDRQG